MKVALVGPPHSGKSTIVAALIVLMDVLALRISYRLVPTDPVDDTSLALLERRERRKRAWDEELAEELLREFAEAKEDLVITDAPGRISSYTDRLVSLADVVIFVHGSEGFVRKLKEEGRAEDLEEWREFIERKGARLILEIETFPEDLRADYSIDLKGRKFRIPVPSREKGIAEYCLHPALLAILSVILEELRPLGSTAEGRTSTAGSFQGVRELVSEE